MMDMDAPSTGDDMSLAEQQRNAWQRTRQRLNEKQLPGSANGSLSLRIPGTAEIWFGAAALDEPLCVSLNEQTSDATRALHCRIYQQRQDITAISTGAGPFSEQLYMMNGRMPGVFDEQVRHLGHMPEPVASTDRLAAALASGSNALSIDGVPMVFGMTCTRLVLNAELLEKCAKAYVLAAATGMPVRQLPWLVRFIANRRLRKDQRRAQFRIAAGHLPEESKGY